MDDLWSYYGTDWLGFGLTFASLHLLAGQRRAGFLLGVAASVAWGAFSVMAGSIPTLTANVVFLGMNFRGYVKWGRAAATGKEVL